MQAKLYKLTTLALLCLLTKEAAAQDSIAFEQKESRLIEQKRSVPKPEIQNSVTIGLLSAINGYTPVYYERALYKFLTIQVGAGFTYRSLGNDFGQMIWNDGKDGNWSDGQAGLFYDIDDQYHRYRHRNASMGAYLSVSPKVYLTKNVMNGIFIAPMLEWKQFRYKVQLADENQVVGYTAGSYNNWLHDDDDRNIPRLGNTQNERMNCTDITLNVGGHHKQKLGLTVGWNVGVGVRRFNAERLDLYAEEIAVTGNIYPRNNMRSYDGVRPLILANIIVGFCF